MNWYLFGLGMMIAVGAFILGTMFGIEYQKVRIQRAWRRNNQRIEESRKRSRLALAPETPDESRDPGWPPIPKPLPPPPPAPRRGGRRAVKPREDH